MATAPPPDAWTRANRLLAALPEEAMARWRGSLSPIELRRGQSLYGPAETVGQLIFPCSAIVSVQQRLSSGEVAEVALIGREGVVGMAMFLGGSSGHAAGRVSGNFSAVVQRAGTALSLPGEVLRHDLDSAGDVMHLLLRYAQAALTQMAQTAVCGRHHTLDQRLCRWLLMVLDRLDGAELGATHAQMAAALGVRREGVTEAAQRLQAGGLIRYHRGHVAVLSRTGLEAGACECYGVVQREYERLLPALSGADPDVRQRTDNRRSAA